MRLARVVVVIALTVGCNQPSDTAPTAVNPAPTAVDAVPPVGDPSREPGLEGLYTTPDEISGFSGTVLELKGGHFRYWFYSDVSLPDSPKFPLTGKYDQQGDKLILDNAQVNQSEWFLETVNGIPVLWRDDGLRHWRDEKKIYDYGVLIKTEGTVTIEGEIARPSVDELRSPNKRGTPWKDPFVHGPQ